ncbi:MAG TPA: hypothetical protein EYG33_04620 [Candidatus Poseidoniales archaeon]|jgi:uncharacterized membrane protein|nr:hypothetical protein [Candidatus Poseidoniales archaeon]
MRWHRISDGPLIIQCASFETRLNQVVKKIKKSKRSRPIMPKADLAKRSLMLKHIIAVFSGTVFILVGTYHFTNPYPFVKIVPSVLPFALFLVYLTGIMEIVSGVALIYPRTRTNSGRFIALFLIAVYPANIYMWMNDIPFNGTDLTTPQHMLRLSLQFVFVGIALYMSGDLQKYFSKSQQ